MGLEGRGGHGREGRGKAGGGHAVWGSVGVHDFAGDSYGRDGGIARGELLSCAEAGSDYGLAGGDADGVAANCGGDAVCSGADAGDGGYARRQWGRACPLQTTEASMHWAGC